jgi:hypothetical protein
VLIASDVLDAYPSYDLQRKMADHVLSAPIPRANPLVAGDDINARRQLFQPLAEEVLGLWKKLERRGRRTPPQGSSAGKEGNFRG